MFTKSQTSMKRNCFILSSLISKDFKLKYRRSVLGVLWSVLNPLLMMAVMSVVFSYVFRFEIEHFPVYLILGITVFNLMSDSTSQAMTSILDSASLIKKVRIQKIIFPVEKVLFQLVNFVFALVAVAAVVLFFQIPITWNIVLVPFLIACVLLFSLGLGMLLSALAVFFRDVCHLWSVVITAWSYATPLFYPVSILPEWAMPIMSWNPMYQFVNFFREIVLWGVTPGLNEFAMCAGMAFVTLVVGFVVFRKLERNFILYV